MSMAIKVIKEGQYSTTYVNECKSCHSVFTFKIADLQYALEISKYFMYCPECCHREIYDKNALKVYDPNKEY